MQNDRNFMTGRLMYLYSTLIPGLRNSNTAKNTKAWNHPIILKWVTGSARYNGKPIQAKVYTNGQVNCHIKVFQY